MKYPNIIFFRLSEYSNIDNYINNNKNNFDCTLNITNNLLDLNNIYDVNYHLIITYGKDKKEYKLILEDLYHQIFKILASYTSIDNIELFNYNVNYQYINLCIKTKLTRPYILYLQLVIIQMK